MKDYKIIKFTETEGNVTREFVLNEASGEYTCAGRGNKGKLDLIGDPNIKITKVQRPAGRLRALGSSDFESGDIISDGVRGTPIRKIYFKRNKVHFQIDTFENNLYGVKEIPMAEAVKYVAPVVVPVVKKATKPVSEASKPSKLRVGRVGQNVFQAIEDRIWEYFHDELEIAGEEGLNGSPIRLEKTKKVRRENLHNFLIKFFEEWNNEKNTVWADSVVEVDPNDKIQTPIGKKRSLGDIFMICKYYYPQVTLKEVIIELYRELPNYFDETKPGFRSCVCSQINKRVWWYNLATNENNVGQKTTNDEFGKPYRFYLDNI